MKHTIFIFLTIFLLLLNGQNANSQFIFMESYEWGTEKGQLIPDNTDLSVEISSEAFIEGDTVNIVYKYPSGQVAIEGQYTTTKYKNRAVLGTWNQYYSNGKLWTKRRYNNSYKLDEIIELNSPTGVKLEIGNARPMGKQSLLTGLNYVYDKNGDVINIAEYSRGSLQKVIDKDLLSPNQMNRVAYREFYLVDSTKLVEVSLEEAIELQKTNQKTILLNVSTQFNGYTRKGYSTIFTKPEVAGFIKEHFILSYFDLEDSRDVIINKEGSEIICKGNKRHHEIFRKVFTNIITGTPTFFFIEPELKVAHTHAGIEVKNEHFIKTLSYYTSKSYLNIPWEQYLEE